MPDHVERARLLLAQGRYPDAEKELRQQLAAEPENDEALSLLAQALGALERFDEARQAARKAIGLAPDDPWSHYALGAVQLNASRFKEAEESLERSIAINPDEASFWHVLGLAQLGDERWKEALDSTEQGLSLEPEDVDLLNLRIRLLTLLGRKSELASTTSATLALDPDNANSHASAGWAALNQGDADAAQKHFREALRLEPDNEFARSGILDSLRIRNPLYRLMFRYFTWIARLGSKGIWLVLGAYMGFRILRGWMQTLEGPLRVVVGAVVGLYIVFALSTWLATPMVNVALFFHPLGRMALTRKERWTSAAVAGLFVASLCLFATAFVWGLPDLVVPALQAMMSSLVVAAAGPLLGGRFAKVGIAAVVASLAALGFLLVSPAPLQGEQSTDTDLRLTIFPLSCLLTLAFLIGSQFLAQAPHRR